MDADDARGPGADVATGSTDGALAVSDDGSKPFNNDANAPPVSAPVRAADTGPAVPESGTTNCDRTWPDTLNRLGFADAKD